MRAARAAGRALRRTPVVCSVRHAASVAPTSAAAAGGCMPIARRVGDVCTATEDAAAGPLGLADGSLHEDTALRALLGGDTSGPARPPAPAHDDDILLHGPADTPRRQRQLLREDGALSAAVARHRREAAAARARGDVAASRPAVRLIASWNRPLVLAIRRYLGAGGRRKDQPVAQQQKQQHLGHCEETALELLRLVDPEKLAAIAIYEVLASLMRDLNGIPLATVATEVGDAVRAEINAGRIRELKAAAADTEHRLAAASQPSDSRGGAAQDSAQTRKRRRRKTSSLAELLENDPGASEPRSRKEHLRRKTALFKSMAMPTSTSAINYAACQADVAGARWSRRDTVLVGSTLIDLLLSSAVVETSPPGGAADPPSGDVCQSSEHRISRNTSKLSPAIRHYMHFDKIAEKRIGTLSFTDAASRVLMEDHLDMRDFVRPKLQPMIVRPRPWISPNHGPYLSVHTSLVRAEPNKALDDALANADMHAIYDGLNALGETPWKVNVPVLNVARSLWDDRKAVAGLVSRIDVPMPKKENFYDPEEASRVNREVRRSEAQAADASKQTPDAVDGESRSGAFRETGHDQFLSESKAMYGDKLGEDAVPDQRAKVVLAGFRAYRRERRKAQKINRELFSLRAHTGYQLDEAQEFADEEKIYLPHNVDFRGRAYPIPVYLQHMGADLMRSMLSFAEPGIPLGERGVYWLKVHLANLLGADKLSFSERIDVADDAISRVLATATDPMNDTNLEWWSNAEDPFQLLAACFEFGAAVGRHGNETAMRGYHSRLPVSMDGSCNGLQHYAALGRDSSGGKQVNLIASDRPQDVYTGVAELVKQRVAAAAAKGDPIGQLLLGKVSRKVVKQTVMTSVYGVTLIGARAQIENRLREIEGFPEDKTFAASLQLARWTLASLGDIFSGATRTMDWLSASAKAVSRQGSEVQWLTPLGLPVIQPYRKRDAYHVRTAVQRVKVGFTGEHMPVSRVRQQSAFAPNFVHSIDSSHMLLTAVECRARGLTFAAVHDSFWTHAAHVDQMNALLRETFVRLHTRELLVELRDAMLLRHPDARLPPLPQRGGLDLNEVLHSPYFFS